MATQVVMFSVLLFGTSGVVLDFGRVYSEHSIMQTYTDQAALAAAAELDRDSDSISRAVAAVFGGTDSEGNALGAPMSRGVGWSGGENDTFNVSHLIFVSELGADSGSQTSLSGLESENIVYVRFKDGSSSGNAAVASTQAEYVIAVAEERSVRNSLMQLINSSGKNAIGENNIVRTVSAAQRKQQTCGEFSNLVVCNPWEQSQDESFASFMNEPSNRGIQFMHEADGTWDERWSLMRRAAMESLTDVSTICDDPQTMPGAFLGMSDALAETYNTICHLAASRHQEYCVGDEIALTPVTAEEVTTALSTRFDMWDDPIAEVLEWDLDADGRNSLDPNYDSSTASGNQPYLDNFQPDLNIYKGRVYDSALAATNAAAGIPLASRRNYVTNSGSPMFDLVLSGCLRGINPGSCVMDNIGPPATYTEVVEYYISNFFNHFVYIAGTAPPPISLASFHDAYLWERGDPDDSSSYWFHSDYAIPGVFGAGGSLAVTGEDASLASITPFGTSHEDLGLSHKGYTNFLNEPTNPVSPGDTSERRRMSVTVVNCGTIAQDPEDGLWKAEVVDFIDLHLLQPPSPTCAGGGSDCANNLLVNSRIYTEYIDISDYEKVDYPVLVR